MTTAKHTPGPWEFGSGDNYYVRADAYPKKFPHRFKGDDLGDYLAYVGNRTDDFGEANARLIAAAPELKEFADSILIYQVEGDEEHVWLKFGPAHIVIHKANSAEGVALLKMEAARRAAITKAEGAITTSQRTSEGE